MNKYSELITDNLAQKTVIPLLVLTLASIYFTREPLFRYGSYIASGVFYATIITLTAILLKINYKNRFTSVLQPIGKRSYPLYLLHIPFFIILHELGIIVENSLISFTITLVLFPLLLKLSIIIEDSIYRMINY